MGDVGADARGKMGRGRKLLWPYKNGSRSITPSRASHELDSESSLIMVSAPAL